MAVGFGGDAVRAVFVIADGLYELSASLSQTHRQSVFSSSVLGFLVKGFVGGCTTSAAVCLLTVSTRGSSGTPPDAWLSLTIGSTVRSGNAARSACMILRSRSRRAAAAIVWGGGGKAGVQSTQKEVAFAGATANDSSCSYPSTANKTKNEDEDADEHQ